MDDEGGGEVVGSVEEEAEDQGMRSLQPRSRSSRVRRARWRGET